MVRINKEEQAAHKLKVNKDSPFFIPVGSVFNSRNMEHGAIVQIGDKMKDIMFWNARRGDTLIFHVPLALQKNQANGSFYTKMKNTVTMPWMKQIHGGIMTGVNLVPHPNFVFLKTYQPSQTWMKWMT